MKKPEFEIEVKRCTTSSGYHFYNIYLYKDGKLLVCYMKESIVDAGDLVMKLEAFTKYYTEDND